jgi:SAM-dependent methyltransferase
MAPDNLQILQSVSGLQEAELWTQQSDADAMLQASRRVDWRFLLPNPNLAWVAHVGPARGTLIESLRLFSRALTIIDPASGPLSSQFDVVVVSGPSRPLLRQAVELVRPGGFLYIEAFGPLKRSGRGRSRRGLRFAADYIVALGQLGINDATAYWHWPNFEACAEIVPLADRAALTLAFARRRSGAGARVKSAVGRVLLQSGLFARLAPCFSIVGQRS